jgi:hypothetical protein
LTGIDGFKSGLLNSSMHPRSVPRTRHPFVTHRKVQLGRGFQNIE